jgi:membrane protease YdiL (CAAX protease family)
MAGILALVDMLLLNKGIADEMLGQEIKLKHNSIIMISLQLIPMAIAAFAEELCFRSYLYKNLNKLIGNKLLCIIIINIAFALCHIYQGIIGVISAFILGMALSLEFKKRGSIFTISLFHLLRNIISII